MRLVPSVARNVLPIMVVAMQYCEEAATELLPMMAQRGRAIVLRAVRIKIVILRPLLRVLITPNRPKWTLVIQDTYI